MVIGVAARAAVLGDNIGYLLGRRGLRPLLAGRRSSAEGAFPRAIARRRHDRE